MRHPGSDRSGLQLHRHRHRHRRGLQSDPTGSVDFSSDNAGGDFSTASCTLVSDGAATFTSSCSVTYTGDIAGTDLITATYNEASSAVHATSTGTDTILVTERSTSTLVDCPASLALNQGGTCTATVTDTDAGTKSDPSGSVDFTRTGPGGGSFSSASCTLVSDGAATFTSSCSVTYTPSSEVGSHVVQAAYNEASSSLHATSAGSDTITVTERSTSTVVDCPATLALNQGGLCTATVTDTDGGSKSDPAGSVDFLETGVGTGTFSAASCTLVSDGAATFTSSCSVTYTPATGAGTHTVRADYNEASSSLHATSFGTDSITVTERSTSTAVTCTGPVGLDQGSLCTATVTDTDAGSKSDPTGIVDFNRSGPGAGSFTPASCTLTSDGVGTTFTSKCLVTYTPTSGGGTHTINAIYREDSSPLHASSSGSYGLAVIDFDVIWKPPIDGPSVLNKAKHGRVIPVGATLTANGVAVTSGVVHFEVRKLASCPSGSVTVDEIEVYAPGSSFTANLFEYQGGQWRYNFDTSSIPSTTYPFCARGEVWVGGTINPATGQATGGAFAGYFLMQFTR